MPAAAPADVFVGCTLGHYVVRERLGAGGMGVVYRAFDVRLQREVAVKVLGRRALLGDDARGRFQREALALSRLNHPNVATVHDFDREGDVDFLVMELIPGRTLDEVVSERVLEEREAVALAIQLAEGLAAAHDAGLTHRDLKPGNVRVTPDGRLKILDFGLAGLHAEAGDTADTGPVEAAAGVVGSPPYMSPEQLLGQAVDVRSDLYSAGVVLYELVTRRRPFPEPVSPRLVQAILLQPPPSPTRLGAAVSPAFESVILRCLEKDPARRYGSARELLAALDAVRTASQPLSPSHVSAPWSRRRVAGGLTVFALAAAALAWVARPQPSLRIESIAVLPLENRSGDPAQEYLADGLTDALIADLARIRSLRVISRTSSMSLKGTRRPLRQIADDLAVEAVVEGSVFRSGDRVRVTAELVHAATDRHLWAQTYERSVADVLAVQAEIARSVAFSVRAALTPAERAVLDATPVPSHPGAQDAYLRGRHALATYTGEGIQAAVAHFEEALRLEPRLAGPHVGLAEAYSLLARRLSALPSAEAYARVEGHARRALEIDPGAVGARVSLAFALRTLRWDWAGAEEQLRLALRDQPNHAPAHDEQASLLASRGRFDEALQANRRAQTLDPLSLVVQAMEGAILRYARRPTEAAARYRQVLERDPRFVPARYGLGLAYAEMGRHEEAATELRRALEIDEDATIVADLVRTLAASGRTSEAAAAAERWRMLSRPPAVHRPDREAVIHAWLGDPERALALLDEAVAKRFPGAAWLAVDPRYDPLRSQPAFADILRSAGLADVRPR